MTNRTCLEELIRDIKEKGLMSVAPLKFKGRAEPVFNFLALLLDNEPFKLTRLDGFRLMLDSEWMPWLIKGTSLRKKP